MPTFKYCIRNWAVASYTKYLDQIDRLQKKALKFGYIEYITSVLQIIREKDLRMWSDMLSVRKLLPPKRKRSLRKRPHDIILPK